jgi:hypothetical protein
MVGPPSGVVLDKKKAAMADKVSTYDPPSGCLVRLYWLFFGNALLAFLAWGIIHRPSPWPGLLDAAFVFVAVTLIAARYADIRWWNGQTAYGQPATLKTWRRYAAVVALIALIVWLAARAYGLLASRP